MLSVTNRRAMSAPSDGTHVSVDAAIGAGLSLGWGTASARGDDKSQAELLKPFQGTWASSGEGIDATWTFDGEKIKANVAGMEYTCKGKVDKDAKPHATIDLVIVDGPEEAKGKMSKGIYKLDGEKLTLCVSRPRQGSAQRFRPGRRRGLSVRAQEGKEEGLNKLTEFVGRLGADAILKS